MNDNPDPVWYPPAKTPPPTTTPTSTPTSGGGSSSACSGSNWSVMCKDPTLVSNEKVQTNVVYPILVNNLHEDYRGPYTDEACVIPAFCVLGLGADAFDWANYQTGAMSRLRGSYITADVNYEVHKNFVGYFTTVTSIDVTNKTDSTLSLRDIVIDDKYRFTPTLPLRIDSGQSLPMSMQPYAIPGRSGSINMTFTSTLYTIIVLTANFR